MLTTEQIAAISPIPLSSQEGVPHPPRRLFSLLFSLLEGKLNIRYRDMGRGTTTLPHPFDDGNDDADRPFPETTRWCLGALKILARPGKLASSLIAPPSGENPDGEEDLLGSDGGFCKGKE